MKAIILPKKKVTLQSLRERGIPFHSGTKLIYVPVRFGALLKLYNIY